jgi:putative peptidoglycan lipid II flippase
MPGLYFIALNRILAPAFYAQSDSKSPTLAGIISFGCNIGLAVSLVRPLRGSGIALALSLSSAANTVLLLFFLRKNRNIALGKTIRSALIYVLKMILFSAIASVPVLLLSSFFVSLFAGRGRIISYGMPLALMSFIFAGIGMLLLLVSRDRQIRGIVGMIKRKRNGKAE